jgi:DNA-binding LytR/AlgR family response regulator
MHIAICDDNVADRKQLERLFKRESDRRAANGDILYVDSYGNGSSLLANPMQYDAFYIDMCHTTGMSGLTIVTALKHLGVNSPIIMCCSEVNYREQEFPDNTLFIDKPISAEALTSSVDRAREIKTTAEPLIALREENDTIYVTEPDILYAIEDGRFTNVTLTDGRVINTISSAMKLFDEIESHLSFVAPSAKDIINCRYIATLEARTATMTDGTVFKVHKRCLNYAKKAMEEYRPADK